MDEPRAKLAEDVGDLLGGVFREHDDILALLQKTETASHGVPDLPASSVHGDRADVPHERDAYSSDHLSQVDAEWGPQMQLLLQKLGLDTGGSGLFIGHLVRHPGIHPNRQRCDDGNRAE